MRRLTKYQGMFISTQEHMFGPDTYSVEDFEGEILEVGFPTSTEAMEWIDNEFDNLLGDNCEDC